MNSNLTSLFWSFFKQSFLKQLLTDGEGEREGGREREGGKKREGGREVCVDVCLLVSDLTCCR